jgi:hypothetical protein
VAQAFFINIVHLDGIPNSIVSDRDLAFTRNFWRKLFMLSRVQQRMSTTFHGQSDGQCEVVNNVITMYLLCLIGDHPQQWLR